MIILKFGGTSVRNAKWMDEALSIAINQIDNSPLIVSSAMATVTNGLVAIGELAGEGDYPGAMQEWERLKELHHQTAKDFLTGTLLDDTIERIDDFLNSLASLIKGLCLLQECSPTSNAALLSHGELLSTTLLAARAKERGIEVTWLDARELMITDDNYTSALPDLKETYGRINKAVTKQKNHLYITQGFIGATRKGVTTILGRGGSDYSATLFGSALNAKEVQIWTDVTGIMTTDPRIVPEAKTIDAISYEEAAEMAYFGAKVVHPSTIQPAVDQKIPVWVKNTGAPEQKGTAIIDEPGGEGLRAIAGKKEVTLINISSSRMLNAYGFLKRIFEIFETHKTPVDLVATSEVSVSMTIEDPSNLEAILEDLNRIGKATSENSMAIVCLVGRKLWMDSHFVSRVFSCLKGTPIRMISLGSSDINLSLVVPEAHRETTIKELHREFYNA